MEWRDWDPWDWLVAIILLVATTLVALAWISVPALAGEVAIQCWELGTCAVPYGMGLETTWTGAGATVMGGILLVVCLGVAAVPAYITHHILVERGIRRAKWAAVLVAAATVAGSLGLRELQLTFF